MAPAHLQGGCPALLLVNSRTRQSHAEYDTWFLKFIQRRQTYACSSCLYCFCSNFGVRFSSLACIALHCLWLQVDMGWLLELVGQLMAVGLLATFPLGILYARQGRYVAHRTCMVMSAAIMFIIPMQRFLCEWGGVVHSRLWLLSAICVIQ
jgi:hypothetical protein